MSKRGWTWLAWAAALVMVAGPVAAQGTITLSPGSDIFTTPNDGQTQVDLGLYDELLQDLLGGSPSPSIVPLSGKPIAGLGQTDTVVERLESVTLGAFNSPVAAAVELTGLSLKGQVSAGGATWNLLVTVSPSTSSDGTVTIARTNAEGGNFDATIDVVPRLIFTNPATGDVVDVDCAGLCDPEHITLSSQNSAWVIATRGGFSPASAGVPNIATGTDFDGDYDGVADDEYTKSNFFPGFDPVTYAAVAISHDHPPVAQHKQRANTQCKTVATSSASSTGPRRVSEAATAQAVLCAVVADPTEPTEPSTPVATEN